MRKTLPMVLCDSAPLSLTITAPAAAITAAATTATGDARRVAGLALPYGVAGQTSAGALTVNAGAVTIPPELRRVKLFTEHGRQTPVGYALEATEQADGLHMAFRVGATPNGDAALVEAAEGIRDALSVELANVQVADGVVTAAELVAVVLTSVPAFADARVAAHRPAPGDPGAPPIGAPGAPPVVGGGRGMLVDVSGGALPPEASAGRQRGGAITFAAVVPALAAAIRDNDIGRVNAALSDIVPAQDTGGGFMGTGQWVGEIWGPIAAERHFWNRTQHSPLTSGLKVYGWKWETLPQVGPYLGNKTPIPSNTVSIVPAEAPIIRYAGGWDIDRIFVDLGDPGFLEAFFRAATVDLGNKLEAGIADQIEDAATVAAGSAPDVYSAVSLVVRTLVSKGATPSAIALAGDVYADLVESPRDTSPWWLPEQARLALGNETATLTDLDIFMAPSLEDGTVLGWDRRAVTSYEATPLPIRVQAVNIPNGGIDLGVFAYASTIVNDDRGLALVNVAALP